MPDRDPVDEAVAAAAAQAAITRALDSKAGRYLKVVIQDAVGGARVAGATAALDLVAAALGTDPGDLDVEGRLAADALAAALGDGSLEADGFIAEQLGVWAGAVGRDLAQAVADVLGRDDLAGIVVGVVGDGDLAGVLLDHTMSVALGQGQRVSYADQGVTHVDWLAAQDTRVDDPCLENEAGNPYPIASAPPVPQHYQCRCCWAPVIDQGDIAPEPAGVGGEG